MNFTGEIGLTHGLGGAGDFLKNALTSIPIGILLLVTALPAFATEKEKGATAQAVQSKNKNFPIFCRVSYGTQTAFVNEISDTLELDAEGPNSSVTIDLTTSPSSGSPQYIRQFHGYALEISRDSFDLYIKIKNGQEQIFYQSVTFDVDQPYNPSQVVHFRIKLTSDHPNGTVFVLCSPKR